MINKWAADMAFFDICLSTLTSYKDEDIPGEFEQLENSLKSDMNVDNLIGELSRCMSSGLLDNFISGYKRAIDKYGLVIGNDRIKERLIHIILSNRPDLNRETLLLRIKTENEMARKESIMDVMRMGIHLTKDENGNYVED